MKLPNGYDPIIPESKLVDYLLSVDHPRGKHKAAFFDSLGFGAYNTNELRRGLARIAAEGVVLNAEESRFGTKYLVAGILDTPSGDRIMVYTVWIVEPPEPRPRLVTAYPF